MDEPEDKHSSKPKGGFLSSLLLLGTTLGLSIASGAWYCNLIVFLINVFNVKNIAAAQINNIFSGFINIFPLFAAMAADSAFSPYVIILLSSIVSLVGVIMFTFIVTVKSLRPPPCTTPNSDICVAPSSFQYSILYITLALASLGLGGTRFILGTMGANQLDKPKHQVSFFNWFVFILYISFIIGYTVLIYLEDNVSWALAYGIALVANVIGIILFVSGSRIYRKIPSQKNPFVSLVRVFVATFKKRNMRTVNEGEEYYYYENPQSKESSGIPSKSLRFFNRAALVDRDNLQECDQQKKSWRLCTVEEVEDLKKVIKIMPLWSTSILLSVPIGVANSFTVFMALVMDRSIGSHFKIPAGTFVVLSLIFTAITTSTFDRFIAPLYKKLTGKNIDLLKTIGAAHVCTILTIIGFALIERKRLGIIQAQNLGVKPNSVAPMSALWLVFPLSLMGIGEGLSFPAGVALYYQEFPRKLRSTSTAMISLLIASEFYLSSAYINLVGRLSSWLPNDINHGRVDNVFWILLVMTVLNYAYFLVCAMSYKYNNPDLKLNDETSVVAH